MRKALVYFFGSALLFGCSGTSGDGTDGPGSGGGVTGGTGGTSGVSPGTAVTTNEPLERVEERQMLEGALADVAGLDASSLRARFPTAFEPAPTYDPSTVAGLDIIQASALNLRPAELEALSEKGFVVCGERWFPCFAYGYSTIYAEDLPVYISADSILESVHRSYDRVLEELEVVLLSNELSELLLGMRERIDDGAGAELGEA